MNKKIETVTLPQTEYIKLCNSAFNNHMKVKNLIDMSEALISEQINEAKKILEDHDKKYHELGKDFRYFINGKIEGLEKAVKILKEQYDFYLSKL